MATITTRKMLIMSKVRTWHTKLGYLVKFYSIPSCLVVNNDQTRIHLIPTFGEKTWENKGTKHI
jgi:hypothetical protein